VLLLAFLAWRLLGRRGEHPESAMGRAADTAAMAPAGFAADTAPAAAPARADTATGGTPSAAGNVAGAMKRASTALAGLQPGYDGKALTEALNLNVINFASGSAAIPSESHAILDQSAKAIEGSAAGTVLEVGGHTDNTGAPAANEALSARRAAAVRDYLVKQGVKPAMLTAKGYGASKPVADNGTADGRFRNRRIEFTAIAQ
jgi:outer membrane protein OmpA-like peptidoglycan-associated protein